MITQEVIWCGKLITQNGISVYSKRKQALSEMLEPTNGSELMQFVHAANWIRTSISNYSIVFATLNDWLNLLLEDGKRTSRRAEGIRLMRDSDKRKGFEEAKQAIQDAVIQAHPNPTNTFVLMTDASDNY